MIPTLSGRTQTRLFLFVFLGLPITALFAYAHNGWVWDWGQAQIFFLFLTTLLGVGLLLDPVYIFIQSVRWDRDWPFAFQFFFSIIEFGIVVGLMFNDLIPWLPMAGGKGAIELQTVTLHFTSVFIPSFLALLGPLSVFFIRWRFKAGQFGKL